MKIKLSVIILNFNTVGLLKSCLSAVLASKGFEGKELEVIVVDNNSSDNSVEMVQKEYPEVKLIRNKKNFGFSAGNNIGIKNASGKFLLLLNSDTLVDPDSLITVLKVMENDRSIGAATCLLQTGDGKLDPASHRGFPTLWNALSYFLGLEKLFPRSRFFGGYHQGWKNLKVPHEVDCISAAFMMIPAEVVEKVGLLDERFFMYGEDVDWCLRIRKAGFKIFFYPGVKTLHLKRQSGREQTRNRDLRRQTQNMFLDSMWQFYEKHYIDKYPELINWLAIVALRIYKLSSRAKRGDLMRLPCRPDKIGTPRNDGKHSMKVVIDARLSGLKHAGIGRYTQMLCEHLGRVQSSEFRVQIQTISSNIRHYSLKEQVFLIPELLALKPDLVHFPHFNVPLLYNRPFVVTIHDLLWHEQVGTTATTLPAGIYWLKYLAYRLVLKHAVLKSKAIIVPSEWVKKQLIRRFSQTEEKIHVIYEGVAEEYGEEGRGPASPRGEKREEGILELRGLEKQQYLIYTGSLYPHKNVNLVLDILPRFPDLKFIVACARNVFWERFKQEIEKRGLQSQVVLAGFVPDDELAVLYKNALAFVFPSKSEGFGLPGLEAMAAGCPVISSNAGSLPEIYGGAAVYFSPDSEKELIRGIREIRNNQEYRKKLIELGKKRTKIFSWEKCAKETMEVYESCLGV